MQLARMIRADLTKGLQVSVRYPLEFAASLITVGVFYLGILWVNRVADPTPDSTDIVLRSLTGYLLWYYLALVTGSLSASLHNEATEGTLEQLWLTPSGPARVLLSRLLAVLIRGTAEMLVILVIMMALTGVAVEPTWRMGGEGLLVLSITLLGLCGFGYALAGLTLMFKRVAGLVGLFNLAMLLLMGFGGTLGSELMHAGTSAVLPLVLGSHLIYRAVSSVTEGPALSEIGLLAGNSLAYLLVGIWAFRRAEYHTRRRGSLGQF